MMALSMYFSFNLYSVSRCSSLNFVLCCVSVPSRSNAISFMLFMGEFSFFFGGCLHTYIIKHLHMFVNIKGGQKSEIKLRVLGGSFSVF